MLLHKMSDLAAHLRSKNLFAAEQLDYWMENGVANYAAKRVSRGLLLCRFEYEAVISVERFSKGADLFLAHICCWLMEFDSGRDKDDLPMPQIDVTPLDDLTVDIEVKIKFIEDITVLPHEQGEISLDGEKYRLDNVENNVANSVGVGDNTELPTDLVYTRPE